MLLPANVVEEAGPTFTATQPTVIRSAGDRGVGKRWSEALVAEPSALSETRTTTTDVDGAWGFADVPVPAVYELLFAAPGFTSRSFLVTTADPAKPVLLDVVLSPGDGALGGNVTGPGGPLGGVDVTATDGVVTYHTTTATEGDVGAWDLPVVGTPARYIVTFERRGFGTETLAVDLPTGGSETALTTTMVAGVGSIAGKVHLAGFPLGNVTVTATNGAVTRSTTTLTEGSPGTFLLPQLPIPATYTVTVARTGFVSQSLTVELTGTTDSLDIALIPATGLIWGRVTVAGEPDPAPGIAGVGIDVTDGTYVYKSTTALTPAGLFELGGLPPGTYTVTFSRFEYETASSLITVGAGDRQRVDISLERRAQAAIPENARLSGTVFSAANGQPLEGARVTVRTQAPFPTATVGPNGTYAFEDLPLGTFKVDFEGPAGAQHQLVQRTVRLGTATDERLDVTLVPLGSLVGHVTDNLGRALGDVNVQVYDDGDPIPTAAAVTNPAGDYNIQAVLSSGAYEVGFEKAGFQERRVDVTAVVGATVRADGQLTSQPRIHGRILQPQGSPTTSFAGLGNTTVTATSPGQVSLQTTTLLDGFFEFTPAQLRAGVWTISAGSNAPGSPFLAKSLAVAVVAGDDANVELALSPASTVSGTAFYEDANGNHVAVTGLTVRALQAITGWVQNQSGSQSPQRSDLNATVQGATWSVAGHVAETATYEFQGTSVATRTQAINVVPGQVTPSQAIEMVPLQGAITGTVATDPADQKQGHTITLTAPPSALQRTTQTDAAGAYRFDNLDPGVYTLVASNNPAWITSAPVQVTVPLPAGTPQDTVVPTALTLNKRSSITVTVTDATTTAAINGATVELLDQSGTVVLATATPTGNSATFGLLELGAYQVRVQHPSFQPAPAVPVTISAHGVDVPAAVTLTRWSVLSGTVAGERAGQTAALEGAQVTITPGGGSPVVRTTLADGGWSLGDLAAGTYTVVVSATGYESSAPVDVVVTAGVDPAPLVTTLVSELATFQATVHTDANATPINELTVVATGTRFGAPHELRCTTDPAAVDPDTPECTNLGGNAETGVFSFTGFDATSVHLALSATGHHPLALDADLDPGVQLLPTITLLGNAGALIGVVRWAPATMTGSPQATLDGALVVLSKVNGNSQVVVDVANTQGGGTFAFNDLEKGTYALTVSASGFANATRTQLHVNGRDTLDSGSTVLAANNRAVVVSITSSPGGAALGNATVSLSGAPLSSPLTVTDTGGTGAVTLNNVPPFIAGGGYSLQITRADHRTRTVTLAVPPGTGSLSSAQALDRFAIISGTVAADPAPSGNLVRPLNGVTLTPTAPAGAAINTTADSDDGSFEFRDLEPGSYTLSFSAVTGFITPPSIPVTVTWGDEATGRDATYLKLAKLTVTLDGAGAPGKHFTVDPAPQSPTGPYSSGAQLTLLPDVAYTIEVAAVANTNAAPTPLVRTMTPGEVDTVQLTVPGEGTLRLTLTDSAADPIAIDDPDTAGDEGEAPALFLDGVATTYTVEGDEVVVAGLAEGTYDLDVRGLDAFFDSDPTGPHGFAIGSGDTDVSLELVWLGQLVGTVVAAEDGTTVITGTAVCLDSDPCQNTVSGGYTFLALEAGDHDLHADAFGSCAASPTDTFTVTDTADFLDEHHTLELTTSAGFGVMVEVDGAALDPGDNPTVTVTAGGQAATVTKTATGEYAITAVRAGTVVVHAEMGNGANRRVAEVTFTLAPCDTAPDRSLNMVAPLN
ncbi:MAG: carboxypeptidase regulatory-like domain-containing protein [Acidimicrobiales bacterium]